ncbi:MAG: ribonuclease HII [Candidatus Nanoarchaeia archaeon]|nr:ribonuclease HII [Candidatus Nanoarchaeia archaeon]
MKIAGLEEAGRGPVIGPMIVAGVLIDENDSEKLREIGVRDSKLLTRKSRENLAGKMQGIIKAHKILEISPNELDNENINMVTAKRMAEIINELNPDIAIIDCPSNNINSFTSDVERFLTVSSKIKAEHKADINHPVVSAASIFAKVNRDKWVSNFEKKNNVSVGSGYPHDPETINFLKMVLSNNQGIPSYVRKKWSTVSNMMNSKKQKKLFEY